MSDEESAYLSPGERLGLAGEILAKEVIVGEEEKIARLQEVITKQQKERLEGEKEEEKKAIEDKVSEEMKKAERLDSRWDREDRKVTAYAIGSFEFSVRLRRGFSGRERMAEFLRIGKRDTKERIEELLCDLDFKKLAFKYDIVVKLIKISPHITATFEVDKD